MFEFEYWVRLATGTAAFLTLPLIVAAPIVGHRGRWPWLASIAAFAIAVVASYGFLSVLAMIPKRLMGDPTVSFIFVLFSSAVGGISATTPAFDWLHPFSGPAFIVVVAHFTWAASQTQSSYINFMWPDVGASILICIATYAGYRAIYGNPLSD